MNKALKCQRSSLSLSPTGGIYRLDILTTIPAQLWGDLWLLLSVQALSLLIVLAYILPPQLSFYRHNKWHPPVC